jgi:HAD superfamily hydrolase (TIGR01490 family)
MKLAIFDLEGTLYTGNITRGIASHHQEHRVKRVILYTFFLIHMPIFWLGMKGILSGKFGRELWTRNMGWLVGGWSEAQGATCFEWIAREYVFPRARESVLERMRHHQQQGDRVILVSGTFAPLLAAIGRQFGVEETVGTPLKLKKGRYTGGSEAPVCQGVGKVQRLEEYLGGLESIDWVNSSSYADSHFDRWILDKVGHPVAVHPDSGLEAIAREKGWEILK